MERATPTLEFGAAQTKNFFEHLPDRNQWYRGREDLSGSVWVRGAKNGRVAVLVQVWDNDHRAAPAAAQLKTFDSLQVSVLEPQSGALRNEYLAGLTGADSTILSRTDMGAPWKAATGVTSMLSRSAEKTSYLLMLPIAGDANLKFVLRDRDQPDAVKQEASWSLKLQTRDGQLFVEE